MNRHQADTEHGPWTELAVGHAMDSLEPEDEQSFRAHLPGCAVCAGVVADTRVVMGHLAYAVEPMEPPASLRSDIRAAIASTERRPSEPVRVSSRRRRSVSRLTSRPWMAVAAGLALLMTLSVWNVVLQAGNRSQQRRLAQASLITNCLREVGCRTVELRTPNRDQPRATALVRARDVQLIASELPRNDTDAEIYVLWQRGSDNRLVPLNSFDITRPGATVVRARLSSDLNRLSGLAVSREPGRRTPVAPSETVAIGTLNG